MTHGLLGLIVHKSRITEAWKDKLYSVRESVRAIKIIICIFLEYTLVLQFWKEYKFLDALALEIFLWVIPNYI